MNIKFTKGVKRMTEKRFTDDGIEEIENQSFTDNLTGKTYWIDNGLDEIVDLLNEQHETIQELNDRIEDLYESDRALRKMCSNATYNWTGICVKRKLFEETLKTLKELGSEDLADDLSKTSIVTGVNGC